MNTFFSDLSVTLTHIIKTIFHIITTQLTIMTGINGTFLFIVIVVVLFVLWRLIRLCKKIIRLRHGTTYFDKNKHYNEQLSRVKIGGYQVKALLNKTEQAARKGILEAIYDQQLQGKLQLCTQVSLGEFIRHDNYKLFQDINSKRVDFLLVDSHFVPIAVIEIHGSGHFLSADATQRDQIKQFAIEDAGIQYLGIVTGSNYEKIQQTVKKAVLDNLLR